MDALTIMRRALGATGNNKITMLADPDFADEWEVVNEAFERVIDDLSSRHNWPFGRKRAALVLQSTDTTERYAYAFPLPQDCLHLRAILNDMSVLNDGWELRGNVIRSVYSSGLYALYNFEQADADWHPQAAEVLTKFIEADLLRSFNEDFGESANRLIEAEERLAEGRSHVGQQNPTKNIYTSSIRTARRTRKA